MQLSATRVTLISDFVLMVRRVFKVTKTESTLNVNSLVISVEIFTEEEVVIPRLHWSSPFSYFTVPGRMSLTMPNRRFNLVKHGVVHADSLVIF